MKRFIFTLLLVFSVAAVMASPSKVDDSSSVSSVSFGVSAGYFGFRYQMPSGIMHSKGGFVGESLLVFLDKGSNIAFDLSFMTAFGNVAGTLADIPSASDSRLGFTNAGFLGLSYSVKGDALGWRLAIGPVLSNLTVRKKNLTDAGLAVKSELFFDIGSRGAYNYRFSLGGIFSPSIASDLWKVAGADVSAVLYSAYVGFTLVPVF